MRARIIHPIDGTTETSVETKIDVSGIIKGTIREHTTATGNKLFFNKEQKGTENKSASSLTNHCVKINGDALLILKEDYNEGLRNN